MPKQIFLKLPPQKQKLNIEAIMLAYALHHYHKASCSKAVAHLGFAKGSIL